jgi:tetratricopeptide (TPR) repeat protein
LFPEFPESYRDRAIIYLQEEQWEKAAADLRKIIKLGEQDPHIPTWYALALAGAGDVAGHRKACAMLLEKFGKTENAFTANNVAWACVRFPDAVVELSQPLQLAEKAFEQSQILSLSEHPRLRSLPGGRFEDSIKKFEEAIKAHGQRGNAVDWLFLAMVHHQLRHADEAKKWLTKAQQRIDFRQSNFPFRARGGTHDG